MIDDSKISLVNHFSHYYANSGLSDTFGNCMLDEFYEHFSKFQIAMQLGYIRGIVISLSSPLVFTCLHRHIRPFHDLPQSVRKHILEMEKYFDTFKKYSLSKEVIYKYEFCLEKSDFNGIKEIYSDMAVKWHAFSSKYGELIQFKDLGPNPEGDPIAMKGLLKTPLTELGFSRKALKRFKKLEMKTISDAFPKTLDLCRDGILSEIETIFAKQGLKSGYAISQYLDVEEK
jgi:hypothetical protein